MKITLLSHASVIITTRAGGILTDPWFRGKAFNQSWALAPAAAPETPYLDDVRFLWISHEHPDHFSVPTLQALPDAFKQCVEVLFQAKNSDKLFDAMRKMGFVHFRSLPNFESIDLGSGVRVRCLQVGLLDAALWVGDGDSSLLNVNDCDLADADLTRLQGAEGPPDTVLNQFSIAGYDGYVNRDAVLPQMARAKLHSMANVHRGLGATATIPFASFCYFCTTDNAYMNAYTNSIGDVVRYFESEQLRLDVLFPGDTYTQGEAWDSTSAIERFANDLVNRPIDPPGVVDEPTLLAAAQAFMDALVVQFPWPVVASIGRLRFGVIDLDRTIVFDTLRRRVVTRPFDVEQADVTVFAQPLLFSFQQPFGFETLAVSGRFTARRRRTRWRRLKVLAILRNQQITLRPTKIDGRTLRYLASRLTGGLVAQVRRKRSLRANWDTGENG